MENLPETKKQTDGPATGPHRFEMKAWISCAPFERLLHMEILKASDGQATLNMPFLIDLAQGGGLMHGGALVSLADTAVVMAIKSVIPPHTHFGTIACDVKYFLPVKKGVVTARAKVIERDGRILKGRAVVYDEEERAVMEFNSTFKIARDAQIRGITFDDGLTSAAE
jgi:acyl-CoA thioesterase